MTRSHSSLKKSIPGRIVLITLKKRVSLSKLLSISFKKSYISGLLVIWANRSKKMSNLLEKKRFLYFLKDCPQFFPLFMPKSQSLQSLFALSLPWLFKKERPLPSLFKKERQERFIRFTSDSLFHSEKTSNSLKKPMLEFQLPLSSVYIEKRPFHCCL